jgi:hypothetical protein
MRAKRPVTDGERCPAWPLPVRSGPARHRDIVMEAAASATKVCHQALLGLCAEGQPSPAVHKKKWSIIDVRL